MGLRAGSGAASAYRRGADVWKVLRAAKLVDVRARAPEKRDLDAMLAIGLWIRRCKVRKSRNGYCVAVLGSFWGAWTSLSPGSVAQYSGVG